MMDVRGKRVLVVGFARSGRAAADCFRRRGALVTVTDSRPATEFGAEIPELLAQKIGLELGVHREETFLRQDLIVVSPGVPWELPQLQAARHRGIPVVPEVEVASWFLEGTLIGITGTNGKTTTTALLGKMLEAAGFPTFVGGNIGVPLITAVDRAAPGSLLVAELSSFQLEAIQHLRPHVAALLNLTPNHLDRHASFADYVSAKAQIFRNQTDEDYAVLNADDPNVMNLAPAIASRKVFFSRHRPIADGILVVNHDILYRTGNLERVLFETRDLSLPGAFNLENALAATAAACALGADFDAIRRAVKEFRGVEHRLEYVREIRGVEFYNDSKATSVDATAKALSAFERPVHLILGGKDKGAPYVPLRPLIEGRVRQMYLIGAAADRIAEELDGATKIVRAGDLESAVQQAFKAASPGEIVLLSPACASYDQFHDFEQRGRVFKQFVEHLAQGASRRGSKQSTRALAEESPIEREEAERAPEFLPASPPGTGGAMPPAARKDAMERGPRTANLEPRTLKRKRFESVSIYEVGAEEVAPSAAEAQGESSEDPFQATVGLRPLETAWDDLLPFEVAAKTAAADPAQMALGIPGAAPQPELATVTRRRGRKARRETPGPASGHAPRNPEDDGPKT